MASKRRIRRKGCTGKIRYESEEAAKRAIKVTIRRDFFHHRMNAYHCRFCSGWHLGHYGGYRGISNN